MIEKSRVETTADLLREHQVVRAFVASHNNPNQFAEESAFFVAALQAQVEYGICRSNLDYRRGRLVQTV